MSRLKNTQQCTETWATLLTCNNGTFFVPWVKVISGFNTFLLEKCFAHGSDQYIHF